MKKSKAIHLVLITAALSACNQPTEKDWETLTRKYKNDYN